MADQYAGDENAYPEDFTLVDDAVAPTGAAINVGMEALGDRTANLNMRLGRLETIGGLVHARNWSEPSAANNLRRVAFDAYRNIWFAANANNTNTLQWSGDGGQSWNNIATGTNGTIDVACDESGNVVALLGSTSLYEYNCATATWTTRAGALTAAPSTYAICFEPSAALWCVAYSDVSTKYISTSSDRATWTLRTAPANMKLYVLSMAVGAGKLVLLSANPSGDAAVSYSTDGGQTWSAGPTITLSPDAGLSPKGAVAYSAELGLWMLTVTNNTVSKVYSSSDGVTWTLLHSYATFAMARLAVVDRLWVAVGNDAAGGIGTTGVLLYSTDAGVTWRKAGCIGALPGDFKAGGGGFIAVLPDPGTTGNSCKASIVTGRGPLGP